MKFNVCLVLSCYTLLLGITMPVQAIWQERYYNPNPLPDDVILPMPCDGAMAFRKIEIPLNKPLDDYGITLGQDGDEWGYLEQSRPEYISGSFSNMVGEKSRYYLMAKYPLNELQYQSLMATTCPNPSNQLRLPQTSIGWIDAMSFANNYNIWLRKNKPEAIPREDGALGFLRLPTEIEWEFAARGGLAVPPSDFRDQVFPMPEGMTHYAWFAGPQSANGKLQLVGLLKPNPLGLHDMLGNVSEMMFEPFRLNKLDRQHGQAGGYILRGGNYLTPQAELRSALRIEEPYYDNNGQSNSKTTGMRLVMVAPALTSRQRILEIEKEWLKLGVTASKGADETLKNISSLAVTLRDTVLKQQLEKLRLEIRANSLLRDEQRDQAVRSFLQLGTFLCTKLQDDGKYYDHLLAAYLRNCNAESQYKDDVICRNRQQQMDEHKGRLDFVLSYYADTIVDNGITYNKDTVDAQINIVKQVMASRGKTNLHSYLDVYWGQLQQYWKNGKVSRDEWLENCKIVQ